MRLGTILPTRKSVEDTEEFATRDASDRRKAANKFGLCNLQEVNMGGETRYYDGPQKYAVIGRDMLPKWFVVRADGDYPIRKK